MSGQSPLKGKPLRLAGESLDKEIDKWVTDKALGAFFVATSLCAIAYFEWYGFLTHSPRRPVLFTVMAAVAVIFAAWRFWTVRARVRQLRLGRDGERVVGQFLERLREGGGQVFHDIPGEGFNLDHVVISTHGIYAIETKTLSKPWPQAKVVVEGDSLRVAGEEPDRNPIVQVTAAAKWLEKKLQESTGKRFFARGVVVFPGWFVEQRGPSGEVWVLEPKALPAFIKNAPEMISASDVALAAFHLSRYVRSEAQKAA
jgi:Nuclease-related domain